jgi:hypothetical protein
MASGFSLGAAIGATGKFPKLKAPVVDDSAALDRKNRELQTIRRHVLADNNTYHNVLINENKDETAKFIQTLIRSEKEKDPNVLETAYGGEIALYAKRNSYLNDSKKFFDIEDQIEIAQTKKSNVFVSPGMKMLNEALKTARSREELLELYQRNPQMFADGYVEFDLNKGSDGVLIPSVLYHDKYDFTKIFNNKDVFDINDQGVIISEKKKVGKDAIEIDRYKSIPVNRAEALELKKTNPDINEETNAFDLGKDWFSKNPNAQLQYAAQLAADGKPDAQDPYAMSFDDLYNQLFNETILPNIPAKYENQDKMFNRTNVSVFVDANKKTAPTDFTVGALTANYKGKSNALVSDLSAAVSSDAGGTDVQIATNSYIVDMTSGLPAFTSTSTQKDFKISHIAIFPAITAKDTASGVTYLRPMTVEERKAADAAGTKYLMFPFAIGNQRQLNVSKVPEIGVGGYAIPLYQPDSSGRWVIPQASRKQKTTGGSPLLSQITQRSNWSDESLQNWDAAFFKIMAGIRDQDDIK